ncbi:MAG: AraC family transcriptional regulator [Treponema sp.]|nr:AraC family transcriptional regulator [Treponema sp.]
MYKHQIFQWGQMYLWEAKSDREVYEGRSAHCHKECEIFYMLDGEVEFLIEGHKSLLASDSFLLIPSNCFHQWKYPSGKIHHRFSVHFLPELLNRDEQDVFMDMFAEPLHFLNGSRYNLNFFFQAIVECGKMETPLQMIASKNRMVSFLSQIHLLRSAHAVKPLVPDERIQMIIKYVSENLREDISLDELSDKFAVTKNHLNALFHKAVGTPIMKYISAKRLEFARQEILGGARLGEAAYMAGFNDYTTFYRAYKSFYGCPPSELLVSQIEPLQHAND